MITKFQISDVRLYSLSDYHRIHFCYNYLIVEYEATISLLVLDTICNDISPCSDNNKSGSDIPRMINAHIACIVPVKPYSN